MILKYKIHYKFYCVIYSIIIYLLYTDTRLGRLCKYKTGFASSQTATQRGSEIRIACHQRFRRSFVQIK
jgi:hypothetical protein